MARKQRGKQQGGSAADAPAAQDAEQPAAQEQVQEEAQQEQEVEPEQVAPQAEDSTALAAVRAELAAAHAEIAALKADLAREREARDTPKPASQPTPATADLAAKLARLREEQAQADAARDKAWHQLKAVVQEISGLANPDWMQSMQVSRPSCEV